MKISLKPEVVSILIPQISIELGNHTFALGNHPDSKTYPAIAVMFT